MLGHVRRISGSTSAESGGGSGNASGGASNLHPYHGIVNTTPPLGKIKYREQGVDELLQLKLHQALAAADDVPEGSTIVLATGDGNMGQFNEEGFLGKTMPLFSSSTIDPILWIVRSHQNGAEAWLESGAVCMGRWS
jgi:hypothetical protein